MNKKVYFMPLGGGQEVGASCYFLKLGDEAFLLDCGTGKKKGFSIGPSFLELERSGLIHCKSEIKHIFVSHSHIDHVGFMPDLMRELPDASFYMTEATKELARFQLYDRNFSNAKGCVDEKLAVQCMFDRVKTVSFMEEFFIGEVKITIYPAGHIPGAMMVMFSWQGKNFLYTGDYSVNDTVLTGGCFVPPDLKIDCLIMCALHGKNDACIKSNYGLEGLIAKTEKIVNRGKSVYCVANQLSKGIEFLKAMNDKIDEGSFPKIPVYISPSVYSIVKHMENLSVPLVKDNVFPYAPKNCCQPHVVITAEKDNFLSPRYESLKVDFTIHDDFKDTVSFVKKMDPKTAILVHCASFTGFDSGMTVEQILMRDAECNTQFIFAENEDVHRIC